MALSQKPGAGHRPGQKPWAQTDAQRADAERHATDELTDQCQQFEDNLDELRARYELYFLGVERLEPNQKREEMKRRISRMKTAFTRNAGVRFRIETLHARYLAYERMWLRAARQREEGTYHRDLFKARRRGGAARPAKPDARKPGAATEEVDLSDWDQPAPERVASTTVAPAVSAGPPTPPALARSSSPPRADASPAPKPATAGGLSEAQMRSLYDAYITAKKRCNEDVSKLSYDAVSRSVSKQIPEIATRFRAKAVDFKVVIKDGKALLKATPKA